MICPYVAQSDKSFWLRVVAMWSFKELRFTSFHSIMHAVLLFYNALCAADNWWVKSSSRSRHGEHLLPFHPLFSLLFHLTGPQWRCFCSPPPSSLLTSQGHTFLRASAAVRVSLPPSLSLFFFFLPGLVSECMCQGERWMSRERHELLFVAQALERLRSRSRASWCCATHLEGAARCNGLLQIDGEIRRHTIRGHDGGCCKLIPQPSFECILTGQRDLTLTSSQPFGVYFRLFWCETMNWGFEMFLSCPLWVYRVLGRFVLIPFASAQYDMTQYDAIWFTAVCIFFLSLRHLCPRNGFYIYLWKRSPKKLGCPVFITSPPQPFFLHALAAWITS